MRKPLKSSAKVIWTYGIITGICLRIAMALLSNIPSLLLAAVAFLLVGMLASKQTGQEDTTGMQAGLVAGLTVWVIYSAVLVWGSILPGKEINFFTTVATPLILFMLILGLLVFILGLGAMMGMLGGLISGTISWIGKRKAKVPPVGDPMLPQQQSQQQQ